MIATYQPSDAVPSLLLDTSAAAKLLGVSSRTLEGWRLRGGGPIFCKLGGGDKAPVRYRLADLEAWIGAGLRESTSSACGGV